MSMYVFFFSLYKSSRMYICLRNVYSYFREVTITSQGKIASQKKYIVLTSKATLQMDIIVQFSLYLIINIDTLAFI